MIVCLCRGLGEHAIRATIARGGDTLERLAAITDDTAAVANTPIIHSSTPEINPA